MEITGNKYALGEIPLIGLAEKYGTPLYIYYGGKIRSQYERLKNAFRGTRMKICYACKALTNTNILKLMLKMDSGLDTVSIYEVELGLKAGFKPEHIIFTPNGVGLEEIQ